MKGPHRLGADTDISCDVVIVGSGAGGAVVGERLTRAGLDVVMLEEGPAIAAEAAPATLLEAMPRLWRSGGLTAGLGRPNVTFAEGCCVGGGTEINSAIMQRVPDELLDEWAARYQIEDFGSSQLKPYYDAVLDAVGSSLTRGALGPPSDALRRGAESLGWEVQPLDRAQRNCVGTNYCLLGCPTGGKQSMTASYIPRALAQGMRLVAECRVTRFVKRRGHVTEVRGVARRENGTPLRVRVRCKTAFLCAGAVHTPSLLQRSGFRASTIGRTLRMHPTIKVIARFKDEIKAHEYRLPLYAITEFMPDIRIGGSVFMPGFFGLALAEDYQNRHHLLPDWSRCGLYYAMVRGQGAGRIITIPGIAEPIVQYELSDTDWSRLTEGVVRLAEAMFAAGAEEVIPSVTGHPGWRSFSETVDKDLDLLTRARANLMTVHLAGSCPPGERQALCATNSHGRLYGCTNVIVADASQIPEAPGVNPQATIMAIALRNAEAFLGQSSCRLAA